MLEEEVPLVLEEEALLVPKEPIGLHPRMDTVEGKVGKEEGMEGEGEERRMEGVPVQ